jgi:uncharacterized membrane protein
LPDTLAAQAWTVLHLVPPSVLLWLAYFFGRTLRAGQMPLIERIARRGNPALGAALCPYTRRLTALWCAWFIAAAAFSVIARLPYATSSAVVWGGTVLLFVGERLIRPWLFPAEVFPGLVQQIRDTLSVWRPRS